MSILILDYKKEYKDKFGKRHKRTSLVKCDKCGLEREIQMSNAKIGNGISLCKHCSSLDENRRNKISQKLTGSCPNVSLQEREKRKERFIGKNNPNWKENREEVKANLLLKYFCKRNIKNILYSKNESKSAEILGYTKIELRKHIESTWESWMNWNNYGSFYRKNEERKWSIDHIKPINQFKKEGIKDIRIINALSNLRALDARENTIKRDKFYDLSR